MNLQIDVHNIPTIQVLVNPLEFEEVPELKEVKKPYIVIRVSFPETLIDDWQYSRFKKALLYMEQEAENRRGSTLEYGKDTFLDFIPIPTDCDYDILLGCSLDRLEEIFQEVTQIFPLLPLEKWGFFFSGILTNINRPPIPEDYSFDWNGFDAQLLLIKLFLLVNVAHTDWIYKQKSATISSK